MTVRYLEYHESLMFRGFLSASSVEWSYKRVFGSTDVLAEHRKFHNDALFYYMTLKEFELVDMEEKIVVGDEVSQEAIDKYIAHCHREAFPPEDTSSVCELVGDGHEKVMAKLTGHCFQIPKRRGRGGGVEKPYGNGWFMVMDPKSSRIVSAIPMINPENNAIVTQSLESILDLYPNCNAYIMDRNCK